MDVKLMMMMMMMMMMILLPINFFLDNPFSRNIFCLIFSFLNISAKSFPPGQELKSSQNELRIAYYHKFLCFHS